MPIPKVCRCLLNIYVESVLKAFKHFNSFRIWSLGVGFWCFRILLGYIDTVKVLIKILIFCLKGIGSRIPAEFFFLTIWSLLPENRFANKIIYLSIF